MFGTYVVLVGYCYWYKKCKEEGHKKGVDVRCQREQYDSSTGICHLRRGKEINGKASS